MRKRGVFRSVLATVVASGLLWGCAQPECAQPDYSQPECRVIAENEVARIRASGGFEVRFQQPGITNTASWDARGLLAEADGVLRARVGGPGRFALSVEAEADASDILDLQLANVDPDAAISVAVGGAEIPVPPAAEGGLTRSVRLSVPDRQPVWIRGTRNCPDTFRLAFVSDIQTNPSQFVRIVEALGEERAGAEALGEPLVALVLPGDLTESSRDDEFDLIRDVLDDAPVPVVVTPGNHDIYRPSHPHFNRRFGAGNHVVEVCDLRLVMLDTGSGSIARSVEARLPELFRRGDANHLIIAMHHPPYAGLTGSGWSQEDRAQRLLVEAAIAGVDLIVAGHNHSLRDFASIPVGDQHLREIVVGTGGASQGLGAPRYGYLRVTVSPQGLQTCFVEVPGPGYAGPTAAGLSQQLPYCG